MLDLAKSAERVAQRVAAAERNDTPEREPLGPEPEWSRMFGMMTDMLNGDEVAYKNCVAWSDAHCTGTKEKVPYSPPPSPLPPREKPAPNDGMNSKQRRRHRLKQEKALRKAQDREERAAMSE
jgi:hypothetical protein